MHAKQMMMALCAAGIAFGAFAEEEKVGYVWAPGEGLSYNGTPLVATEVGLAFDSKFLSYGLVDNDDPILTPSAKMTFGDWVEIGAEALFDMTQYGKKAGYGNRAGRCIEFDPGIALVHAFDGDDFEWLPTKVEFSLGYMYEYHPRAMGGGTGEPGDDTQFVTLEVGLPDLWIEPTFTYERDIDRDDGTYLSVELGHTFPLIGGGEEGADPVLAFRPSVAQGFGNNQRVRGYLCSDWEEETPLDRAGLMDTSVKGELAWQIADGLSLSAYVAYYDFLFDSRIRESVRGYEARGRNDHSWNFVTGIALTAAF
ncbi:MAG: hypothetical protein J6334_05225 [Kiritimatiellae bacterium]|nr:hypothetical protein [Kiritimatiellia bacterium]